MPYMILHWHVHVVQKQSTEIQLQKIEEKNSQNYLVCDLSPLLQRTAVSVVTPLSLQSAVIGE